MAPGYACLGMGFVEDEIWQKCSQKPIAWSRYIDDILDLWPYEPISFKILLKILNNLYLGELEFTSEFAYREITFLDLRISPNARGFLETDLFVKPSFKNLHLEYDSYHSKHDTLDNIA
ncbi:hypothetical protein HOLleu_05200 [Holothuria leucospilota]|uniref:Reverse transcriptase domain-containing protein n=1 Tax=Holothuria leucospilota TaxID=206669 RepID=A0A9Q1CJL8_HOLLE|nr:hypothetical protein HOLleu_05200 [Holothuria leucospilota]